MSNSLQPHGLLHPWNSPGKNTGGGCHVLLQENFPSLESNQHLLHLLFWQADSLPLSHLGGTETDCCQGSRAVLRFSDHEFKMRSVNGLCFLLATSKSLSVAVK